VYVGKPHLDMDTFPLPRDVSNTSRCDGTQPSTPTNKKLSHEEIGSLCARAGFDADHAERAWAQSEVGEGVEEVWERVVSEGRGRSQRART
jgi:hypothetical protein